jgi:hypothetical protein
LCGVLIERRDSTVIIKDRHRIKQPKLLCLCGRSLYCLQRAAIRVSHSLYEALEKTGTEAGVTDFEALRILKSTSRAFSVAPASVPVLSSASELYLIRWVRASGRLRKKDFPQPASSV